MDTKIIKKVLVIDDDDNLRKVLVDALTVAGFEPTGAGNGEDGLKKALESHPDVIMLDISMPKMDGWQVLDKLRSDEWGKTANVIMLTSSGQMGDVAHALGKNVLNYITKSDLDLNNIAAVINNLVNNPPVGIKK
jgi:CheY-like chemotaxis protein